MSILRLFAWYLFSIFPFTIKWSFTKQVSSKYYFKNWKASLPYEFLKFHCYILFSIILVFIWIWGLSSSAIMVYKRQAFSLWCFIRTWLYLAFTMGPWAVLIPSSLLYLHQNICWRLCNFNDQLKLVVGLIEHVCKSKEKRKNKIMNAQGIMFLVSHHHVLLVVEPFDIFWRYWFHWLVEPLLIIIFTI